jgi:hypothetical protein
MKRTWIWSTKFSWTKYFLVYNNLIMRTHGSDLRNSQLTHEIERIFLFMLLSLVQKLHRLEAFHIWNLLRDWIELTWDKEAPWLEASYIARTSGKWLRPGQEVEPSHVCGPMEFNIPANRDTEEVVSSVTLGLYSGGTRLKSWPERRLSWVRFLVDYLSPSKKIPT